LNGSSPNWIGLSVACLAVGIALPAARADQQADAMRAAAKRWGPSLVRVQATTYVTVAGLPGLGRGSRRTHQVTIPGVVVSADGWVLFPAQALDPSGIAFSLLGSRAQATVGDVKVLGADGAIREAQWVGRDPGAGLAFVRVGERGRAGLAAVDWTSASAAQLGDPLFVLSLTPSALGRSPRVDLARVAFRSETHTGLTPQLPHAIGGLVVSGEGAVGLLGTLPDPPRGDLLRADLLALSSAGYVIGAQTLAPLIAKPPAEGTRDAGEARPRGRAWLGVKHQVVTPELAELQGLPIDVGIRIVEVYEGPAKVAGLEAGDILVKMDGEPLDLDPGESFDDLVEDFGVGAKVPFIVRRGGKVKELEIELGRGPIPPSQAERMHLSEVGVLVRDVTFFDRVEGALDAEAAGAVVLDLDADGAASRAGVRAGDLILGVDGKPLQGLADLQQRLLAPGDHPLTIRRQGKELTLSVRR